MNRATVLLADDHPLMRKGLREVIEEDGSFAVVAEAGNGEQALTLIRQHHPTIAVLDIDMPRLNGLETAAALAGTDERPAILFLTMYTQEAIFNKAMESGAVGYVLKDSALSDIVAALHAAVRGETYISPSLSGVLLKQSRFRTTTVEASLHLDRLTPAERRVLRLIAEDRTSKEIADLLSVSIRTVDTHRSNIAGKLELHGPNALLKFALEHRSRI